ncbi:unnamed protein product, partial [Iphiclides podalirius]
METLSFEIQIHAKTVRRKGESGFLKKNPHIIKYPSPAAVRLNSRWKTRRDRGRASSSVRMARGGERRGLCGAGRIRRGAGAEAARGEGSGGDTRTRRNADSPPRPSPSCTPLPLRRRLGNS